MNQYRSDDINLIMAALSKAQGSYKSLQPNEDMAGGRFANLTAILDAVRDSLSANEIAFYQYLELKDEGSGASLLWTSLAHSSGQYIATCSRVVVGQTFKETFNAIERYKRLSALSLLGIAPVGRDPLIHDDNGVQEEDRITLRNSRREKNTSKAIESESISTEQYEDLMWELEKYPDIVKGIQKYYNISSIADLPKSEFYNAKAQIRKIKKTHEDYAVTM